MSSYVSYLNPFSYFGGNQGVNLGNNEANDIQIDDVELDQDQLHLDLQVEEEEVQLSPADRKHNASVDKKMKQLEARFRVTEGRMQQALNMKDGAKKDAKIKQIFQKFNQLGQEKARLKALYR